MIFIIVVITIVVTIVVAVVVVFIVVVIVITIVIVEFFINQTHLCTAAVLVFYWLIGKKLAKLSNALPLSG